MQAKKRKRRKTSRTKMGKIWEATGLLCGIAVVLVVVLVACVAVTMTTEDKTTRLIAWVIGIFLIYWVVVSVEVVGPEEAALLIYVGIPVGRRGSGPCFVAKFLARLERFPTTIFELDIVSGTVVTMKGIYKSKDKDGAEKQEICEKDPSEFDATVYFSLPYTSLKGLIRSLKAKVPRTAEGLKAWIDTSVNAAIGRVGSRMTWRQFSEERQEVCRRASIILREGLFGLAGLRVIIPKGEDDQKVVTLRKQATQNPGSVLLLLKRTDPSEKLQKAIQQVNIEALQEEAALSDATEIATKSGGAFSIGLQKALSITPEEAAERIMQDPELKTAMLGVLDGSIRDHIAGNEGKLVRVSVDRGSAGAGGNAGGGGNQLAGAIVEAIATLDGMKNGAYKSRLRRILGLDDESQAGNASAGSEGQVNFDSWARSMGTDPDAILDDELELEDEEAAETAD